MTCGARRRLPAARAFAPAGGTKTGHTFTFTGHAFTFTGHALGSSTGASGGLIGASGGFTSASPSPQRVHTVPGTPPRHVGSCADAEEVLEACAVEEAAVATAAVVLVVTGGGGGGGAAKVERMATCTR